MSVTVKAARLHAPNLAREVLNKLPRRSIMAITLLLIMMVGIVDYLTAPQISLSILYLGPTGLAAWYLGKEAGTSTALFSALVGRTTDIMTGVVLVHPWLTAWNVFVHLGFMLVIVLLLTYQKAYLRIEQQLARTDSLTGLFNHGELMERLQYILDIAAREQWSVTLAYIDIDDFKHINDQKGHAEGDRILRVFAAQLTASTRQTDIIARVGGDEFAVILPHTDRIAVEMFSQKLLHALSEAWDGESNVTCSIGCLTFPPSSLGAEYALKEADLLMYKVKKQGKGKVAFAEHSPQLASAA